MFFTFFRLNFAIHFGIKHDAMKRLSRHIIYLLRLYDSVVLPGEGVFGVSYVASAIDRDKGLIYPPHFEIVFSHDPAASDGKLLESYIRREKVGKDEAKALLMEDTLDFRKMRSEDLLDFFMDELKSLNPHYPVLKVETLRTAAEISQQQDSFETEETPLAELPDVAESLALPPEEEEGTELELEEGSYPLEGAEEACEAVEAVEAPALRPQSWKDPNYYYIPIHKKVANIAAAFLLVVVVGIAALLPIGKSAHNCSTAAITPISVADEDSADYASGTSVQEIEDAPLIEEEEEIVEETEEEPIPGALSLPSSPFVGANESDRYFAIVAAFKTLGEAEKYIDSHKGDVSRFKIIKNSKFYLISAAAAPEKEELLGNMPLIRSDYPDVWVYTIK